MAKIKRQPVPEKPLPKRVPAQVADRTLWDSYLALPPKTRLQFSLAVGAFALTGLAVSNYLEKKIPAEIDAENK
ncbi:hypothetical protein C8R46DRAFT_226512 [Mycena filopes]|nr:hypothetical protein C8R46DRAFT_226512 [Mycena filopes]